MIYAQREHLGWSSSDSWAENFPANSQSGLAILCEFTLPNSLLLMVWYHVALCNNRNSMLRYPQSFL